MEAIIAMLWSLIAQVVRVILDVPSRGFGIDLLQNRATIVAFLFTVFEERNSSTLGSVLNGAGLSLMSEGKQE